MRKPLFSVLIFAATALGDFNPQVWHYRAPISLTPGASVSELTLNSEVFRHSSNQLSDLRIVGNNDAEVPYLLKTLSGNIEQSQNTVLILNKAWTRGKGVQAVLDLKGHAEHNRLQIATYQHNFKQTVVVETSDNQKEWATVLSDGVIFDISRPEATVSDLTLTYPTSTRRYVRITVPGWTDASLLESASLAEYKESDATRDIIGTFKPAITGHQAEQTTEVLFDLGFAGQPCDRLILQVAPGLFARMVEVSTSNDLKTWNGNSGSYISRTSREEHLTIEFGDSWQRYIRLTIFNADSAPLAVQSATASSIRRVLRFPSGIEGQYWLYLDNSAARSPIYDFAKVEDQSAVARIASVGVAEPNPAFRPPQAPFSERKPWLLNTALGISVALMAFIIYRFARKATSPVG